VLLALTIPSRSPADLRGLLAQAVMLFNSFKLPPEWQSQADSRRQAVVQTLETITNRIQSPAQQLEHSLTPWSTYVILPIFALANAGIILNLNTAQNLLNPISLGIILGLVVGKPVGITLLSWLAVRSGLAELPGGIGWSQVFSTSCLAGIGFTMSLFITNAAFTDSELQATAKLAVLVASVLAAVLGTALLFITSPNQVGTTQMETAVTT
jgi:NhaA family Na+:H+ antiporter